MRATMEERVRTNPLVVACPRCKAAIGRPCRKVQANSLDGKHYPTRRGFVHAARRKVMSKALMCDNCGKSILEDDADQRLFWVQVGMIDGRAEEACGVACARDLLDALEREQRQFDETPLHTFFLGGEDGSCAQCGGSLEAAWHELESVLA